MKSRLEELYKTKIKAELFKELNLSNIMDVPAVSKIVVNVGVKEAVADSKAVNVVKDIIDQIAGQSSVKTLAQKSIASFGKELSCLRRLSRSSSIAATI